MKIALDWIADYLSPTPPAPEAADALMNAGLPVESMENVQGVKGPTQVLDVEVTSNRTDCFCHVGLARELSALTAGVFSPPKISIQESTTAAESLTSVEIQDPAGCPYYSARILRNVKVGPSPEWLQRRLQSIGLRPINNIVDVTNFVLMELGQPLHAFDFDQLQGRRIIVRRAAKGEKILAIDGHEYPLQPHMLVIADAATPVAIAGVMGGKTSEVTGKTTSILLESARFEPLTIRTTSRQLALKSDSSYRFERGIDPSMAEMASRRAAQLILQLAGGDLAHGAVAAGTSGVKTLQLSMRFKRFHEIVGIPVASDRAIAILSALGFTPWTEEGIEFKTTDDDQLFVRVPPHRLDVDREIDLIEEVARVHGYHNIPTLDRVTHAVSPESTRERAMKAIRSAMVECGFNEAVTLTFIPAAQAEPFAQAFRGTAIHSQHNGWKSEALRPSLLPSLLAVRRTNQYAGIPDAHVFETAATFLQQGDPQTPPLERRTLSAVAGDLTALTGMLRLLAQRLNPATSVRVSPQDFPFYIRGTSGEVILQAPDGTSATGNVGLFTPELQKQFDLRHAAAGCELDLEPLINIFQPIRRAQPVPRYPGVTRDLSIVVEEAVRWADVENAINATGLPHLDNIDFVTTFRNAQIGEGKKSLTLTLEFRDPARTLTSEEVDAQMKSAIELLTKQFNAALRT